jgi:hypothetical protein
MHWRTSKPTKRCFDTLPAKTAAVPLLLVVSSSTYRLLRLENSDQCCAM